MSTTIYVPETAPVQVAVLTTSDVLVEAAAQNTTSVTNSWSSASATTLATLNIAANEPAAGSFYDILASGTMPGFGANQYPPSFMLVWGTTTLVTVQVATPAGSTVGWTVVGWVNFVSTTACYSAITASTNFASAMNLSANNTSSPTATTVTVNSATTLTLQGQLNTNISGGGSGTGSTECFLITKRH